MNKNKLLIRSLIAFAGAFAIFACFFVSINFINNSQEPQDLNFKNSQVNVNISQTENNNQVAFVDNTENSIQKTNSASEELRYANELYPPEIASSMADIQKSYNEQENNNVPEKRYEIVKPFTTSNVRNIAGNFISSLTPNYNLNATTSTIYWKFDAQSRTLNISGDPSKSYSNSFSSSETPGWKSEDTFYKIKNVVIDDEINPASCRAWFGCVCTDNEKVRLANIASITNLSNLDMTGVTDASFMFTGCDLLANVTASNKPQSMDSITNMEAMFSLTKSITDSSVYESVSANLNTIVNARYAFANNTNIQTIDVSNWSFNAGADISFCFGNAINLKTITSKYNTDWSELSITANGMFKNCESLEAKAGDKTFTYKGNEETIDTNPLSFMRACNASHDGLFTDSSTKYSITLENDGHGTLSADKVLAAEGESIILTATPNTNYVFDSYETTPSSLTITNNTFTMPAENVLIKAKFKILIEYTVDFDMNGHGTQVPSQTVEQGNTVSEPVTPTDGDYEFAGWYDSEDFTGSSPYNFNTPVTSNLTLHARWKGAAEINFAYGESYNGSLSDKGWEGSTDETGGVVSKYFDLGTPFTDVLAEWNNSSTGKVTAATKTGYDFYSFDIYDEQKSQTVITDDVTLWYIQWTPQTYNIKYYDQGGEDYSGNNITVLPKTHTYGGEVPTYLVNGEKDNYTFEGWYDNIDCKGTKITTLGATDYTSDINLYAKWTEKVQKFKATVIKGDGEEFNPEQLKGQNWQYDTSGNLYKEFNVGTSYSTILAEWGDPSSWSTATSITKIGMTLTGFTPNDGNLTKDTNFSAVWE